MRNTFTIIIFFFFWHAGVGQTAVAKLDVQVAVDTDAHGAIVSEKIFLTNWKSNEITLQAIPIENAVISELKLETGHNIYPITLGKNENGLLESSGSIQHTIEDTTMIELTYKVGSIKSMLRLPLIFTHFKPLSTSDQLFIAEILIPSDSELREAFPTVIAPVESIDPNYNRYAVNLPVIPSMLKLDIEEPGRFNFRLSHLLDGVAIAVLALVGIVGWKRRNKLT